MEHILFLLHKKYLNIIISRKYLNTVYKKNLHYEAYRLVNSNKIE